MKEEIGLSNIYRKSINISNKIYNIAITPEMYNEQLWLKNNESFRGILNSEEDGNVIFEMELKPVNKNQDKKYEKIPTFNGNIIAESIIKNWIVYPDNIDPEIIVELVKMTNKFQ